MQDPKHLVELYMKSVCRTPETNKYEAHFASQAPETGSMDPIPHGVGPSNTKTPSSGDEDFMDVDKMLMEYCDNPPRKIPYYHLNQSTLVIKR
jgi:hypothetical protein